VKVPFWLSHVRESWRVEEATLSSLVQHQEDIDVTISVLSSIEVIPGACLLTDVDSLSFWNSSLEVVSDPKS